MNISSKLKNIISFMLVAVLLTSVAVLPVSAEESTTEETEHKTVFDMGIYPEYTKDQMKYTGAKSTNVQKEFNLYNDYDFSFVNQTYYLSRPFSFKNFVTIPADYEKPLDKGWFYDQYNKDKGATIHTACYGTSLDDYTLYYAVTCGRNYINDHMVWRVLYYLVPHGARIVVCNDKDYSPGVTVSNASLYKSNGNDKAHSVISFLYSLEDYNSPTQAVMLMDNAVDNRICSLADNQLIATNIPVFDYKTDVDAYIDGQPPLRDPHGTVPEPDVNDGDKLSADSFGWDSFKCRLSQDGDKYQFVYNYTYSNADMKKNPNRYMLDIKYSQSCKYQVVGGYSSAYKDHNSSMNSRHVLDTGGVLIETDNILQTPVYNNGDDDTTDRSYLRYNLYNFFTGSDEIAGSAKIYSSYIYVTVVLKHARFDPASRNDSTNLFDISSDVRTFKFDALTLDKIDNPEEITSDVTTKDITDSSGNIVGKEVSSIVTNDNSTHTTINNYYYDSDGKQSASGSGLGESLSEIASGLISFIKTLVTEGLPAALEILKSLIKTISDLFGFIGDQIGDIGQGTQNGIIAVLKAIPVPLWGICSVALLVFVIVGVLKHFF